MSFYVGCECTLHELHQWLMWDIASNMDWCSTWKKQKFYFLHFCMPYSKVTLKIRKEMTRVLGTIACQFGEICFGQKSRYLKETFVFCEFLKSAHIWLSKPIFNAKSLSENNFIGNYSLRELFLLLTTFNNSHPEKSSPLPNTWII